MSRLRACRTDEDCVLAALFLIETRRAAHPEYPLSELWWVIQKALRYGNLFYLDDASGAPLGASCYSIGTQEGQFEDVHILDIDYVLFTPRLHGTTHFLSLFAGYWRELRRLHPGISELRLMAYADAARNNRLYSKFAKVARQLWTDTGATDKRKMMNEYRVDAQELDTFLERLMTRRAAVKAEDGQRS